MKQQILSRIGSVLLSLFFILPTIGKTVDYDLRMKLQVPRVYNNTQSLGYRKYQTQKLTGTLRLNVDEESGITSVEILGLTNNTHKIAGSKVWYEVTVGENPVLTFIGNNKTHSFKKSSISFYIDANPSYNIGEDEPDNSLLLTLSGCGSEKIMNGYAAGQIGCGCTAYEHVSPTRLMWTDRVVDIAAVHGSWTAKIKKK